MIIRTYHVKHRQNVSSLLEKANKVAKYAVENKQNKKLLTSKYVSHYGLPSTISNQILRKYGRGKIKEANNVNLVIITPFPEFIWNNLKIFDCYNTFILCENFCIATAYNHYFKLLFKIIMHDYRNY